jgi:hypothetical protein
MALKIDALQCGVGVENIGGAKVRLQRRHRGPDQPHGERAGRRSRLKCDGSTLGLNPGQTIADEVLMRLPFTPDVMQVKMRIVLNRDIGRNITVQATRIR